MQILLISLIAWFIAQASKFIYYYLLYKKFDFRTFYASGGMPSAHSAFISSICMQIGLIDGFQSTSFALAAGIAGIVIYDAINVRRAVGLQGQTINLLLTYIDESDDQQIKKLKEVMGHTPSQVLIGTLLGILIGYLGYKYIY